MSSQHKSTQRKSYNTILFYINNYLTINYGVLSNYLAREKSYEMWGKWWWSTLYADYRQELWNTHKPPGVLTLPGNNFHFFNLVLERYCMNIAF